MGEISYIARQLYSGFGQRKAMGSFSETNLTLPYYFLLRSFLDENDLLVILNTKRCRYHCAFCQLPENKPNFLVSGRDIEKQFEFILHEAKHALSILDRVTLSNDGSVLDASTFPTSALYSITEAIREMRRVKTLLLETRLEFVKEDVIKKIQSLSRENLRINILTGFETLSSEIRRQILHKGETVKHFLFGLDNLEKLGLDMTCYVLYKPSPVMTDLEAYVEASSTIDFLVKESQSRNINLEIRLNPMYIATGSELSRSIDFSKYSPPKLTDIMRLAEEKKKICKHIYIGLSTEGLDVLGQSYSSREDFSGKLIKPILLFNSQKITRFSWEEILPAQQAKLCSQ